MKKKFLTSLLSVCLLFSFSIILTACSCSKKDPPVKTLDDITVESDLIQDGCITVTYQPSFDDYFDMSDFRVYANYSDNTKEQLTQNVTMTMNGSFTVAEGGSLVFAYKDETVSVNVLVSPKNINGQEIVVGNLAQSYVLPGAYEKVEPEVTLTWGQTTLVKDTDYTLTYGANDYTAIGDDLGTVAIAGTGNYTGTINKTFDIEPMGAIAGVEFNPAAEFDYNGETHVIAIPENEYANNASIDSVRYAYSVDGGTTWNNCYGEIPADAGTYTVKAIFVMNTGYAQLPNQVKEVTVNPMDIANAYKAEYLCTEGYTGEAIALTTELANLKFNEQSPNNLDLDTDFVVDTAYNENGFVNGYKNNVEAGTAEVKIKGVGNYNGSTTVSFNIVEKTVPENEIAVLGLKPSYVFTGENIEEPSLKVFVDEQELVLGTDYSVTYYDNKYASTTDPKVVVRLQGNFAGSVEKDFDILPYTLDITSLEFDADETDNALTYNGGNQYVTYSQSSLGAWFANLAQADVANGTNYASLIYTPQNTDGMLTISYEYFEKTSFGPGGTVIPKNAGSYYVFATFACVDGTANDTQILNSIEIMKDGYVVDSKQVQHLFAINPFHITKQNTVLQYVENYGTATPHFQYGSNGGIIEPAAKIVVDINADGTPEEYAELYDFNGVENEIGICYERSDYSNDDRIYPASNSAYKVWVEAGSNFEVDADIYLEYYVDSCIITADNFEQYFEIPTVTRIKGNGLTQAMYVSNAVPTSNVISFSETDEYVFYITGLESTETITGLKQAYVTMKMDSETDYTINYVMNGSIALTVEEIDPVTMGIYTEIKINKTENNYETAEDVTSTFFKTYETLPFGTYVYLTTADDVVRTTNVSSANISMTGDRLIKGDYIVEELAGFTTDVDVPVGAKYKAYQLSCLDRQEFPHLVFNSSYEPLNSDSVHTYTTYMVKASYEDAQVEYLSNIDVLITTSKETNQSVAQHELSGLYKDKHYRAVVSNNFETPQKVSVKFTMDSTDVTRLAYRYGGAFANSIDKVVTLQNGVATYTIEADFVYGYEFYILVNDYLKLTVEFDLEYLTEEIYALSHASNWRGEVFYMTKVEKSNKTNYEIGVEFEVEVSKTSKGEIFDICADINTIDQADGYDVTDNTGSGFTETVDVDIYIIEFWKDGDPKTTLAEYQISIKN